MALTPSSSLFATPSEAPTEQPPLLAAALTLPSLCRTFSLLPGITIGDIGKKMGRDGIDNGWM